MSGPTTILSGFARDGSITLSWTISDNSEVSRYEVYDVTDSDFPTLISTSVDANFTGPDTYAGFAINQTYKFEVRVFSGSIQISTSNRITIPNAGFTSSSATGGDAQATVEWTFGPSGENYYYTVFQETEGLFWPIGTEFTATSPYTVTGLTNGNTYNFLVQAFTAQNPETYVNTTPTLSSGLLGGGGGPVPCFPTGTLIRTVAGDKPVETLATGDYVLTADNRAVPIRLYSFHVAKATEANAPYVVPANSLGPRQPARTLHLSPHHAFQLRPGVWQMPLLAAERSTAIQQYGIGEPVTYYHVECPNFFRDNLIADGVICESFGSNQTKGLKGIYRLAPALGGYTRVSGPTFAKKA
jgi:hypothetical protein